MLTAASDLRGTTSHEEPDAGGAGQLRSAEAVTGYAISAPDGDVGHIDDFLVDDVSWAIRWVVADTTNWWPGGRVLLAPEWVAEIRWEDSHAAVDLPRETIRTAPAHEPGAAVDRDCEDRLYAHYHRRRYWEEAA
jgi:hypothetical protein